MRGRKQREGGKGASKRAVGSGLGGWPPVQMISPDSCVFGCLSSWEWGSVWKSKMVWLQVWVTEVGTAENSQFTEDLV